MPSCVAAMPTMGSLSADAARAPVEAGVAVGEDAAVGGDEPVALAVGRGRHADDGLVQVRAAHGAVERGVAVGEHSPIERAQPVALGVRRGGHGHDGTLQGQAAGGALEGGVPEREDAAVRAGQQVPAPVGGGHAGEDGRVQGLGQGGRALVDGPEADHPRVVVGVRRLGRRRRACGAGRAPTARPATSAPGTRTVATAIVTSDGTSAARRGCRGPDRPTPMVPPRLRTTTILHAALPARAAGAVTKSLRSRRSTPVSARPRPVPACRSAAGPTRRPVWAVRGGLTAEWVHEHGLHVRRAPRHLQRQGGPHGRRPHLRDLQHHGAGAQRALRHRAPALLHQGPAGEPPASRGRAARLGRRHRRRGELGRQPRGSRPGGRRRRPRDRLHPRAGAHAGLHRRARRRGPRRHARRARRAGRQRLPGEPAGPGRARDRPLRHRRAFGRRVGLRHQRLH